MSEEFLVRPKAIHNGSTGEERMGQGRENARGFLFNNPDIRERLHLAIMEKVGLGKGEKKEE